jgi:hypothetical protein
MSDNRDGYHEISFKLGRNTEGLESLGRMFEQHCEDDDRRHVENVKLLTDNNDAIATLSKALAPLLASQVLTKKRLALLASAGFFVLIMLSWVMESALKWAIEGILKLKFGG